MVHLQGRWLYAYDTNDEPDVAKKFLQRNLLYVLENDLDGERLCYIDLEV